MFTFFPKNLFHQFTKMANFYFLIMLALEVFPPTSDTNSVPVILGPLGFVVGLSMIKDLIEDVKRYFSDKAENYNKVKVA
jgi:hypothetical protein